MPDNGSLSGPDFSLCLILMNAHRLESVPLSDNFLQLPHQPVPTFQ